jgi:hypothetical protein
MSGLRFFDDVMLAAIETEKRMSSIATRAALAHRGYTQMRNDFLPRSGDRTSPNYHAATEGLNAVRLIMTEPEK